ncbi:MAG: hypothetical protein KDB27_16130 [Planctomycetales bacterium]|nr:hypothetical protein [Planctomycetales bacterium]
MTTRKRSLLLIVIACIVQLWIATLATACNIPVFRYALENWQPDPYRIAVVHRGSLTDSQYEIFRALQQTSSDPQRPANVAVFDVDLDNAGDEDERREIPEAFERLVRFEFDDAELKEPTIAVYFPQGNARSVWRGELTATNIARLVDSPLRHEVIKRLVDGQSAVWVLIKSGDAEKDAAAEKMLAEKLKLANEEVLLPDQSLIEAEEEFRADNPIDLRVEFSMLTVDRSYAEENAFIDILLHSEEDLVEFNEPIAIPIFGRGRTYFALIGQGINHDTILENCSFVCGACSCQVKQQNPGIDTLMAFDWASKITGSAMKDVVLPELTGIGALVSAEVATVDATTSKSNAADGSEHSADATDETHAATSDVSADASDQGAASAEHVELVEPNEQSIFMVVFGGIAAAAAFVFVVSLLLQRAA